MRIAPYHRAGIGGGLELKQVLQKDLNLIYGLLIVFYNIFVAVRPCL